MLFLIVLLFAPLVLGSPSKLSTIENFFSSLTIDYIQKYRDKPYLAKAFFADNLNFRIRGLARTKGFQNFFDYLYGATPNSRMQGPHFVSYKVRRYIESGNAAAATVDVYVNTPDAKSPLSLDSITSQDVYFLFNNQGKIYQYDADYPSFVDWYKQIGIDVIGGQVAAAARLSTLICLADNACTALSKGNGYPAVVPADPSTFPPCIAAVETAVHTLGTPEIGNQNNIVCRSAWAKVILYVTASRKDTDYCPILGSAATEGFCDDDNNDDAYYNDEHIYQFFQKALK